MSDAIQIKPIKPCDTGAEHHWCIMIFVQHRFSAVINKKLKYIVILLFIYHV